MLLSLLQNFTNLDHEKAIFHWLTADFTIGLVFRQFLSWLAEECSTTILANQRQNQAIVICSRVFSRTWRRLQVFTLRHDWLVWLSITVLIGRSDLCELENHDFEVILGNRFCKEKKSLYAYRPKRCNNSTFNRIVFSFLILSANFCYLHKCLHLCQTYFIFSSKSDSSMKQISWGLQNWIAVVLIHNRAWKKKVVKSSKKKDPCIWDESWKLNRAFLEKGTCF